LETEISLVVLSDFSDQTLEWQFSDQQFSGLLVSSDLTESNSSRSESVWLLDTSSRLESRLSGSLLGGVGFTWSLSSSRFSSSLFSTSHVGVEDCLNCEHVRLPFLNGMCVHVATSGGNFFLEILCAKILSDSFAYLVHWLANFDKLLNWTNLLYFTI
jgi:hypothetical protein